MPLMDEFKEERDEIKHGGFKVKIAYFWDYYKWHVIGAVALIALFAGLLHSYLNRKETVYYSAFINMNATINSEDYQKEFAESIEIDRKKESITFDTDLKIDFSVMDQMTFTATQKILVYVTSGDLDSMLANRPVINQYAYNDVLRDLRTFLTPEEIAKYEPYFFYKDGSLELDDDALLAATQYPENPMDPTTMGDPIPVAICLKECPKLRESYACSSEQFFAVIRTSPRDELNHRFLSFVMED